MKTLRTVTRPPNRLTHCTFLYKNFFTTFRSRKRRSSPSSNGTADIVMENEEDEDSDECAVMDECAAAMVLMRLSCSPHSPRWEGTLISFT